MQNWLNEVKSIVATFRNMHFIFFNASGPVILDVNQLFFWDPFLPVWMFININMFCLVWVILIDKILPMKILTCAEVYLEGEILGSFSAEKPNFPVYLIIIKYFNNVLLSNLFFLRLWNSWKQTTSG